MQSWKEGDRSAGICERCRRRVRTRFERGELRVEQPVMTVEGVLVAVCEKCGEVAGVPHSSAMKIAEVARTARSAVNDGIFLNRILENELR